jgi:two-component system, sensor histidine kinase LadS
MLTAFRFCTALMCWLPVFFFVCVVGGLPVQASATTVLFGDDADGTVLGTQAEIWRESGAGAERPVDIETVLATAAFRPLQPADLRAFYTRDVVWLRFSLQNPAAAAQLRYLEISPPRLEDIRLYRRMADGGWQVQQAGMVVPVRERLVDSRLSVFPLTLAAGETQTVLVRISTRNAVMLNPRLWTQNGFHAAERRIDFVNGIEFGALALFVIYSLVFWSSTREPAFLLFGLLVAACLLNDLCLFQYSYVYLWPQAAEWNLRSPGIVGTPTMLVSTWMLMRLLQMRQSMPRLARVLDVWLGMMVLVVPFMLFGDYLLWVNVQQGLGLALVFVQIALTAHGAVRGIKDAFLLLLSFLPMWLVALVRLAQVGGWLPSSLAIDYSQYWALLFSGMMLVGLMNNRLRGERARIAHAALEARLQAEQEAHLHTRELRMAKELAEANSHAKSAFLAQLSHELRTPLHSILGYSGLILSESRRGDDRRRIAAVQQSGRHLLALIDELLDYARLEANKLTLEPRPVYLHSLLKAAVQEVQQLGQVHGISLDMELAAGLPSTFMLDPVRLRQVLLNLMVNACRHSQATRITLQAGAEGGRLVLGVRDNGVGIPVQERARLFRPFEQGRAHREGMGLGLAISQQFVQLMGGDLVCDEAEGGGSHFHFSIPLEEAPEAQVELLAGEVMPRRYGGAVRRILVVDDIAENRALLADVLATLGFDVALAEDGRTALQVLSASRFDLVITDQLMPGMSGWELLRQAREQAHGMPFILLSGAAPVLPDNWPPSLVFAVILMKPAEPSLLAEAIASVLRLEWEVADVPLAAEAMQRPPESELLQLRQAASEGRVSDIEDWVAGQLEARPECRAFALTVQEAVRRLDLPGILQLAGLRAGKTTA